VRPQRRRELTRLAAPAAFLAAATVAVLLIKAGLSGSRADEEPVTTVGALPTAATTTTTAKSRPKVTVTAGSATSTAATTTAAGKYYSVASGDTLGGIAAKYDTTVEELLRLNPGIDPAALHVGQKIRVG
jgi:LysM repeat protein